MTEDKDKTKLQLIRELEALRLQVARFEADESEHKKAKIALRESERRYIALYDNAVVAMFRTSIKDGSPLAVNEVGVRLFGYSSKEEFLSQFKASNHYVEPDERKRLLNELMLNGSVENFQIRLSRIDGTTFWAEFNAKIFPKNGYLEGAVVDITERKRVEEMMIQSEKMLTIGGLAAGLAHEINNPLAGILQNAQVMRNRLTGDLPKNQRTADTCGTTMEAIEAYMNQRGIFSMIEAIDESGRRAAQIVNNMLSFSRKSESRFIPHDLCDLLDRTVKLASNDYDLIKNYDFRQIAIAREYDAAVPEVPCEASQIQQVFHNILKNGAHAMAVVRDEGRWTKDEDMAPRFTLRVKEEGDMARIEIENNGPGMDQATRKRVFEPFFTTKGVGGGTGLGMSVSYFIITENHGGTLSVESAPGKGVNFIICLPLERRG